MTVLPAPVLLACAHGTRSPAGRTAVARLVGAVAVALVAARGVAFPVGVAAACAAGAVPPTARTTSRPRAARRDRRRTTAGA